MNRRKKNTSKSVNKKTTSKEEPQGDKTIAKKTIRRVANKQQAHYIKPFPIVGIGGSAGGLEAFSNLLEHLPPDLGMAYVFIQHSPLLYPTQRGTLLYFQSRN